MNFHRLLFNELIARGQQVHVWFNPGTDGVVAPKNSSILAFGEGVACDGLDGIGDAIKCTVFFSEKPSRIRIPWSAITRVKTPYDDEWQVVATPLRAWSETRLCD